MQTLPGEVDDISLLSGRQRFPLRKYAYALLLLLLLPVLLLVSAPVTAQLIVDSSELTVGLCEVSDPAAESAQVVCAVTARVPSLPMRVTADGTTARASRSAGSTSPTVKLQMGLPLSTCRRERRSQRYLSVC